ncbi:MAG: TRAP transporter substrate-binding protein [Lachnospiraceae bacterium]|nr:TRAP transporter substrate-binding protein [Lachnospiraceae bacterium]
MRKMISLLLAGTMMLSLSGCGSPAPVAKGGDTTTAASDEKLDIIIACNAMNQDHMYNFGLNEFKRYIEEASGGAVSVTAHAGTIGTDESELVEKLEMGGANIVVAAPGFMTAAGIPEIDILSLYYLFDDPETWKGCVNGEFGDKLSALVNEKSNNQFRILAYWSSGIRNYYGKKPVKAPSDMKGLTIRCQTAPSIKEFWTNCGAIPTSVSWNELYQALQQGVVDSAENDYVSFSQKDHHKTPNGHYICETQHTYLTPVLLTTGTWYDGLSDQQKTWVNDAVKAATAVEQDVTFSMAEDARKKVIEDGAEVTDFADMDIEAFKAIAVPIQDKFAEENNMQDYLEMIRSYSAK